MELFKGDQMMEDTFYTKVDQEHHVWQCETCRVLEQFEADGPQENGWRFCPSCGRKIKYHASL